MTNDTQMTNDLERRGQRRLRRDRKSCKFSIAAEEMLEHERVIWSLGSRVWTSQKRLQVLDSRLHRKDFRSWTPEFIERILSCALDFIEDFRTDTLQFMERPLDSLDLQYKTELRLHISYI